MPQVHKVRKAQKDRLAQIALFRVRQDRPDRLAPKVHKVIQELTVRSQVQLALWVRRVRLALKVIRAIPDRLVLLVPLAQPALQDRKGTQAIPVRQEQTVQYQDPPGPLALPGLPGPRVPPDLTAKPYLVRSVFHRLELGSMETMLLT